MSAALQAVGHDYPQYWDGQRFRHKAACEYLSKALPEHLQQVLDDEKAMPEDERNLPRNLRRWGQALKSWTRDECEREHMAGDQQPDALGLSRAKARRDRKHSELMQEAAAAFSRTKT